MIKRINPTEYLSEKDTESKRLEKEYSRQAVEQIGEIPNELRNIKWIILGISIGFALGIGVTLIFKE